MSFRMNIKNEELLKPGSYSAVLQSIEQKETQYGERLLWRYVSSGEIKAARIGWSVRIHLPSLRRFMESRATEEGDATNEVRKQI